MPHFSGLIPALSYNATNLAALRYHSHTYHKKNMVAHLSSLHLVFLSLCQVEVDWEKIQAKIEMELSKERERAANASARSSMAIRR